MLALMHEHVKTHMHRLVNLQQKCYTILLHVHWIKTANYT